MAKRHLRRLWVRSGEQGARYAGVAGLLGHGNIQHTVRYTELSLMRFKNFWRD